MSTLSCAVIQQGKSNKWFVELGVDKGRKRLHHSQTQVCFQTPEQQFGTIPSQQM